MWRVFPNEWRVFCRFQVFPMRTLRERKHGNHRKPSTKPSTNPPTAGAARSRQRECLERGGSARPCRSQDRGQTSRQNAHVRVFQRVCVRAAARRSSRVVPGIGTVARPAARARVGRARRGNSSRWSNSFNGRRPAARVTRRAALGQHDRAHEDSDPWMRRRLHQIRNGRRRGRCIVTVSAVGVGGGGPMSRPSRARRGSARKRQKPPKTTVAPATPSSQLR